MSTQENLSKVWGDQGGNTDPGDAIYKKGWIREIPTFQKFNYILGTCTVNILVSAEQPSYFWQDNIAYKKGATVVFGLNRYTCRSDAPIGIAPDNDPSNSIWWIGDELNSGDSPKLTATAEGVNVNKVLNALNNINAESPVAESIEFGLKNTDTEGAYTLTSTGDMEVTLNGNKVISGVRNSGTELYYDGHAKLVTTGGGVTVTGNMSIDGDIANGDNLATREWVENNIVVREGAASLLNIVYPVGAVLMTATNVNPALSIGGTWVVFSTGRSIVSRDSTDPIFKNLEQTGGRVKRAATWHEHTTSATGRHQHLGGTRQFNATQYERDYGTKVQGTDAYIGPRYYSNPTAGGTQRYLSTYSHGHSVSTVGDATSHTNMMPYQTIYMWKRTA